MVQRLTITGKENGKIVFSRIASSKWIDLRQKNDHLPVLHQYRLMQKNDRQPFEIFHAHISKCSYLFRLVSSFVFVLDEADHTVRFHF